ncbi:MAG: hypothetical protein WCB85_03620 [Candidatus Dormiibacterota bacterium]
MTASRRGSGADVTGVGHALAILGGAVLVLLMLTDAIGTLIVTRARSGRWRPTRLWYQVTWRLTRGCAVRLPDRAGDAVLSVYPAASLLGLLVVWLVGLLLGWALVYWGIGASAAGSNSWGTLVYYAGTSLLTPSFGSARGTAARLLSLVEALTGLGTIALLISYLPALYGAYSRREARLLTLDDPAGGRLVPARVIAVHSVGGNLELLYRFFADWEGWTAEVLESHVSYPMLALFRSQHPGQSWITALGVVTDAATLTCACVDGADQREAYFLHRRGQRAVVEIAFSLGVPTARPAESWLTRENMERAWEMLVELGLPLRDPDEAWARLQDLRTTYGSRLEDLIDYLVAPRGFWGHSAGATVTDAVARASAEAKQRARRAGRP